MKLFSRFPGVGDKTARRFALFLLQQPGEITIANLLLRILR